MLTIKFIRNLLSIMLAMFALANASAAPIEQTAVFAGGCFWGVDAVFKHIKGVSDVVSGYAGGNAATAHYEQVSNGDTGHAESVRVRFNPAQVSYQQLLQVFFSVAHDPTQLNRQGPDTGSQYRSAIFYLNEEQKQTADVVIKTVDASGDWQAKVVTEVVPFKKFFLAEEYHQKYLAKHPHGYTCHFMRRFGLGEVK